MGVHFVHNIGELERDLFTITRSFKPKAGMQVREVARAGNEAGKASAKVSAGDHGKHYYKAFSAERRTVLTWEWGPDAAKKQGGMSFERGSRNQPPHHDIAAAADLYGAGALARRMHHVFDELFWP
jgi:hypothetical protein